MRNIGFLVGVLIATPALAANDSAYTDFILEDKKTCTLVRHVEPVDEGMDSGTFECAGYGGYVVTFSEGDLRSFVSYGKKTADHCSAHQTFAGFNSVGNKIEWRLKDDVPFATILRWSAVYDPEDSTKTRFWLVVTKLEDNQSCHMGYIEGAYPNANEKAREFADSQASEFSCKTSKATYIANPGTATDGIAYAEGCE
jgi:hypothetical protein